MLKLYTGETYKTVSDLGLQILGGYGYCMEYPMQRFFRDSRLAVIGAGTSEIQRNIIARGLGLSTDVVSARRRPESWSSARSSPALTAVRYFRTSAPK